jgi:predicted RNA-binding Zn-ribbon protein involved in translation (DUF1610 family)
MRFLSAVRRKMSGAPTADVIEMGPVQEVEEETPYKPGRPVPYEATSWAPPHWKGGISPLYQRGCADLKPSPGAVDPFRIKPKRKGKAHIVKIPKGKKAKIYLDDEGEEWVETPTKTGKKVVATHMIHECMNCGHEIKVPRKRPLKIRCPDCGEPDLLR